MQPQVTRSNFITNTGHSKFWILIQNISCSLLFFFNLQHIRQKLISKEDGSVSRHFKNNRRCKLPIFIIASRLCFYKVKNTSSNIIQNWWHSVRKFQKWKRFFERCLQSETKCMILTSCKMQDKALASL